MYIKSPRGNILLLGYLEVLLLFAVEEELGQDKPTRPGQASAGSAQPPEVLKGNEGR